MELLLENFISSLPTVVLFIIIAITLYTLSKGADILVDEAVSLSLHWGVPKVVIGATIVSLGTTLPEATVSVLAAVNGNPDLALGNAIGSIIVDTGLIIGIAALIGRLPVEKNVIKRQGVIQLYAVTLLALVSMPFLSRAEGGNIAQWMGFVFIGLLIVYIYQSMAWSKQATAEGDPLQEERSSVLVQLLKLSAGVFLVIVSSKILIPAVEQTATRVGIPQSVIAATLVAFGTSLPELVTAISAVRKGHGELAVGNIVGADILNVLFVVGAAAAVTPGGLQVPTGFYKLQIPAMLIIIYAFRYFSTTAEREITKREGVFLAGIYFVYLALNYILK